VTGYRIAFLCGHSQECWSPLSVNTGIGGSQEALVAMGDAYELLLEDRTLLQLQMQCYAACHDPEVGDATRAGFKGLWELVERLTGLPFQTVVDFFAVGMLINVAAAMDLPAVDERWTSWCPKD